METSAATEGNEKWERGYQAQVLISIDDPEMNFPPVGGEEARLI